MAFLHSALAGLKQLFFQIVTFWPLWLFALLVVGGNLFLKLRDAWRRG